MNSVRYSGSDETFIDLSGAATPDHQLILSTDLIYARPDKYRLVEDMVLLQHIRCSLIYFECIFQIEMASIAATILYIETASSDIASTRVNVVHDKRRLVAVIQTTRQAQQIQS